MTSTDCFISYAREDKELVRVLHDALTRDGKRVWVDWNDILPTSDWLQEIHLAIEAAHTFVFVISPDSVDSEMCQTELSHAVELKRRLVAVSFRNVANDKRPPALRQSQWILAGPNDSLDDALKKLKTIIDKGLPWLQMERKIGLGAGEWQQKGRDASLLLIGSELREAKDWLTKSTGDTSLVTDLHVEYINASSQAASEQLSSHLADLSSELVNKKHDLALLLALEACYAAETVEARSSLLAAVQAHPHLDTWLRGPGSLLTTVSFSADGGLVAAGTIDGMILIWGVPDRRRLARLECYPFVNAFDKLKEIVDSIAFSPDGKFLAAAIASGVIMWDLRTGDQIGPPIEAGTYPTTSLAFSPDSKLLAFGATHGPIRLLDLNSGFFTDKGTVFAPGAVQPLEGHTSGATCLVFSPDGALLASSSRDSTIRLWDVEKRESIGEPLARHRDGVPSVAFNCDGRLLASGSLDGTVILWDVSTGEPRQHPWVHDASGVIDVEFSHDGKILASSARNGTIALWNLSDGKQSNQLGGHDSKAVKVAFSPNDNLLASAASDGAVILWDMTRPSPLRFEMTGHKERISHIEFSPDGNTLATGAWDGLIILTDFLKAGQPQINLQHSQKIASFAFSPNGKIIASSNGWLVMLWDVATGQLLGQMPGHQGTVESIAFSPDGKLVASSSSDGSIILWDVASQGSLRQISVEKTSRIFSVVFSPDGQTLAASSHNSIFLWEVVSGKQLDKSLSVHTNVVTTLAFDHSGKLLASGSMDQSIQLWDMARLEPLGHPLAGGSGTVHQLAFSPTGETLASAHADGSVNLWDVRSRDRLGEFRGYATSVYTLAFNPNGRLLASGSCEQYDLAECDKGQVVLWDVTAEFWKANACRMANRNLTSEEWQRYFRDEPYRKTCPNLPGPQS